MNCTTNEIWLPCQSMGIIKCFSRIRIRLFYWIIPLIEVQLKRGKSFSQIGWRYLEKDFSFFFKLFVIKASSCDNTTKFLAGKESRSINELIVKGIVLRAYGLINITFIRPHCVMRLQSYITKLPRKLNNCSWHQKYTY